MRRQAPALALLLGLLTVPGQAYASAVPSFPDALALRVGQTPGRTRLVLDLSDAASAYQLEAVDDSKLLLTLDVQEWRFDPTSVEWSRTPVIDARLLPSAGAGPAQLMLTLDRPVTSRAFAMGPSGAHGHRLVVDLEVTEGTGAGSTETAGSRKAAGLLAVREGFHDGFSRIAFEFDRPVDYRLDRGRDGASVTLSFQGAAPGELAQASAGPGYSAVRALTPTGEDAVQLDLATPSRVRDFTLAAGSGRGYRVVLDFYPGSGPLASSDSGSTPAPSSPPASPAPVDGEGSGEIVQAASVERLAPAMSRQRRTRSSGPSRMARTSDPGPEGHAGTPFQVSGTWEQEWAVSRGSNQKFEALVDPRLDLDLGASGSVTAIGRLRLDAVGDLGPDSHRPFNYDALNGPWFNNRHGGFELRELYFDTRLAGAYLRLGKQQVVWGQADGIKVLDVVNPQSFREFILDDFDDSRIPLWTANLEVSLGSASDLQLLWIPDTTYHELAEPGSPYELSTPLLVPQAPGGLRVTVDEPELPDRIFADSDYGLRFRTHLGGWDLGAHYLYSYADFPVPFQALALDDEGIRGQVSPEYRRNHLAGLTASNVFGTLALRTELAWNSDTWVVGSNLGEGGVAPSEEFSGVLGLDWQPSAELLLSGQWFHRRLLDHDDTMYRQASEDFATLLWQQDFANSSWQWRAIALYSLDDEDTLLQLRLRYWLRSSLEVWIGADLFDGDPDGLFGQFDRQDRVLMGLRKGF